MVFKDFLISHGDVWGGSPRPSAMGHCFEDDMNCKWCGVSWKHHQRDPQGCQNCADTKVTRIKPKRTG